MSKLSISCIDCLRYEQTQRAVESTLKHLPIDQVYWFSDQPYPGNLDISVQWHTIPGFPNCYEDDYNFYTLRLLPQVVLSDYNLVVHWDGFAINSDAWTDEFFEYDYIGARWVGHASNQQVGNGGFSLRSRRLYKAFLDLNIGYRYEDFSLAQRDAPGIAGTNRITGTKVIPEDNIICKIMRPILESEYGIKFAPPELADRFSIESNTGSPWLGRSLGFHGRTGIARHYGVTL